MRGFFVSFIMVSFSTAAAWSQVATGAATGAPAGPEAVPGAASYYQQLQRNIERFGGEIEDREKEERDRELQKKSADEAQKMWEDLARRSNVPVGGMPTATTMPNPKHGGISNCQTQTDPAIEKAKSCITKSNAPPNCSLLIVNAETRQYFMMDSQGKCTDMGEAEIGRGSRTGDGSTPGDGGGSNKTPPGLLLTAPYDGSVFNKTTAIDLKGAESDNKGTEGRGVVLHASGGDTRGCVGIEPGKWPKVRDTITDKGCGVFVYFDEDPACTAK